MQPCDFFVNLTFDRGNGQYRETMEKSRVADGPRLKNKSRPYIQKQHDSPINVPDTDLLVSWYMHGGYTQIHIASADFTKATFDAVILPLTTQLHGTNVFPQQNVHRNYGSYVKLHNKNPTPGQVLVTQKPLSKQFACNKLIAGIFDGTHQGKNKDTIYKIFKENVFEKKTKAKAIETVAVPVQFGGSLLYDPMDFIESVEKIQTNNVPRKLTLFLCFNGNESELPPFMKRVNDFVGKTESPRRLVVSPFFKDFFPTLEVSTEIVGGGILNARGECIVAAVNSDFNLTRGGLTRSISESAGEGLQKSLNTVDKKHYQVGDVICCDAYKLSRRSVKFILFGWLNKWTQDCNQTAFIQVVSDFVKQCLLTADDNGCVSVAVPVLGSGYLNYPDDVIVSSLFGGIDKYASEAMTGKVTKVVIAFFGDQSSPLNLKLICENSKRPSHRQQPKTAANQDSKGTPSGFQKKNAKKIRDKPINNENLIASRSSNLNNMGARPKTYSQTTNTPKTSTSDNSEMNYEASAEVNPSIRKYLLANQRVESFKRELSAQFRVCVTETNGILVLTGSLEEIMEAEKYLEKCIEDGSMFNDSSTDKCEDKHARDGDDQSANTDTYIPSKDVDGFEWVDVPSTCTSSNASDLHIPASCDSPAPCATSERNVPHGVDKQTVSGYDKTWAVFETNNLFSFETDIKVLTTDKNFTHKHHYLAHVMEKIPECRYAWDHEQGKHHDDTYLKMCRLEKPNTYKWIMIAVVPYIEFSNVNDPKKKEAFKQSIEAVTRHIIEEAIKAEVRSISLPLLVHSGVDIAVNSCLQTMAKCIVECLRDVSTLEHVNVYCNEKNIGKIFKDAMIQKLSRALNA